MIFFFNLIDDFFKFYMSVKMTQRIVYNKKNYIIFLKINLFFKNEKNKI